MRLERCDLCVTQRAEHSMCGTRLGKSLILSGVEIATPLTVLFPQQLCTYQCKAGGVVGGRAWGGDLRFFKNLPSNSLFPLASMISGFFQTVRRMRVAWKRGNICSASVFFVWVGSKISSRRAKKNSNIPSPGRTRSVKCPTAGPTKTIKSPPYALRQ